MDLRDDDVVVQPPRAPSDASRLNPAYMQTTTPQLDLSYLSSASPIAGTEHHIYQGESSNSQYTASVSANYLPIINAGYLQNNQMYSAAESAGSGHLLSSAQQNTEWWSTNDSPGEYVEVGLANQYYVISEDEDHGGAS